MNDNLPSNAVEIGDPVQPGTWLHLIDLTLARACKEIPEIIGRPCVFWFRKDDAGEIDTFLQPVGYAPHMQPKQRDN